MGLGFMGLPPEVFWNMTMHEFNCATKGYFERLQFQHEQGMVRAWYEGYFAQIDLKKYPLKKWLRNIKSSHKQTADESEIEEAKRAWQYYQDNLQGK